MAIPNEGINDAPTLVEANVVIAVGVFFMTLSTVIVAINVELLKLERPGDYDEEKY